MGICLPTPREPALVGELLCGDAADDSNQRGHRETDAQAEAQ
jgi:hypothetical protein